jgi:hypothetical protein
MIIVSLSFKSYEFILFQCLLKLAKKQESCAKCSLAINSNCLIAVVKDNDRERVSNEHFYPGFAIKLSFLF